MEVSANADRLLLLINEATEERNQLTMAEADVSIQLAGLIFDNAGRKAALLTDGTNRGKSQAQREASIRIAMHGKLQEELYLKQRQQRLKASILIARASLSNYKTQLSTLMRLAEIEINYKEQAIEDGDFHVDLEFMDDLMDEDAYEILPDGMP